MELFSFLFFILNLNFDTARHHGWETEARSEMPVQAGAGAEVA